MNLFKKEVDIMTRCIEKLNDIGIFVLYCYDALYCEDYYKEDVIKIMNETILEFNVHTSVKN